MHPVDLIEKSYGSAHSVSLLLRKYPVRIQICNAIIPNHLPSPLFTTSLSYSNTQDSQCDSHSDSEAYLGFVSNSVGYISSSFFVLLLITPSLLFSHRHRHIQRHAHWCLIIERANAPDCNTHTYRDLPQWTCCRKTLLLALYVAAAARLTGYVKVFLT